MQQYVRWLINFKQSVLGNLGTFSQMQQQLDAGENVILLANHQTEADPGDPADAVPLLAFFLQARAAYRRSAKAPWFTWCMCWQTLSLQRSISKDLIA